MSKRLNVSFFEFLILLLVFQSCSFNSVEKFDDSVLTENKYSDPIHLKICRLQAERNSKLLFTYLSDKNPSYRHAAALAFASVQDTSAVKMLLYMLENDSSIKVKQAAAFALGQLNDSSIENQLINILRFTKEQKIKEYICEAIGKSGTKRGFDYLSGIFMKSSSNQEVTGPLKGIFRFSFKGIYTEQVTAKIITLMAEKEQNLAVKNMASFYLTRLKGADLSAFSGTLIKVFESCQDIFTRMNIVTSLAKSKNNETLNFLTGLLSTGLDYRIRVNAIKSLYAFEYEIVSPFVFKMLNAKEVQLSVQASEYFLYNGSKQDAGTYLTMAKSIENWRIRTNLLTAAIKYAKDKKTFAVAIREQYKHTDQVYEKAGLVRAMGYNCSDFDFVRDILNTTNEKPVSTAAMEALIEMQKSGNFKSFSKDYNNSEVFGLDTEFAEIFKKAILSGDIALVGLAAEIIRDENLNFRNLYKDTAFLHTALKKCRIPAEIEIYRELQKTICFFEGSTYEEKQLPHSIKLEWEKIGDIPYDQKINVKTTKGSFELRLFVNEAPISVSNFISLIATGFYNNKLIHRLVPNFVVQDGCPRGDGWGGPDYTICSEFPDLNFNEGSLGMASAGKDTESSQWFITHSPTPHLDGRYSLFGKVIKGMEIVHKLEMGDTIHSMELVD